MLFFFSPLLTGVTEVVTRRRKEKKRTRITESEWKNTTSKTHPLQFSLTVIVLCRVTEYRVPVLQGPPEKPDFFPIARYMMN